MTITVIGDNATDETDDTWIWVGVGSSAQGASTALTISDDGATRVLKGLLQFDFTSIGVTEEASSAPMTLQCTNYALTGTTTYKLHRLLQPWVEAEAIWANYATATPWDSAGASTSGTDYSATESASFTISAVGSIIIASTAQLVTDVTDMIANTATNYGWVITQNDNFQSADATFYSSDHVTAATNPYITVTHSALTNTATFNSSGVGVKANLSGKLYQGANFGVASLLEEFNETLSSDGSDNIVIDTTLHGLADGTAVTLVVTDTGTLVSGVNSGDIIPSTVVIA